MQIGKWGQLQEWMYDWDNPKDQHRHVSHLYGLYPSNQISPYRTPELFAAAKTSLHCQRRRINRMVNGMEGKFVGSSSRW